MNHQEYERMYVEKYGVARTDMNTLFLGQLPREARILEVGCNIGRQLGCLQEQGFVNLYGVELQPYAVSRARQEYPAISFLQGSGFDLPFKVELFDLVCTNGVLIHISPDDLPRIMDEMYRCSRKYIFGFEYFSPSLSAINYRGNEGFLWKADYARIFMERFPDLALVKKKDYPYISSPEQGNIDQMYLLEKAS